MSTAQSVASSVASSVARSVAGGGGGALPDPWGPELLTNPELAGYVAGSPGTPPTGWTNLITVGSLGDPRLTFATTASQRGIFQSFAVTPGQYKAEVTATLNSGAAAFYDLLWYGGTATVSYAVYIDDVLSPNSSGISGTKRLRIVFTVTVSGTLQFRFGSGMVGNRTQNVTHIDPTLKRLL